MAETGQTSHTMMMMKKSSKATVTLSVSKRDWKMVATLAERLCNTAQHLVFAVNNNKFSKS